MISVIHNTYRRNIYTAETVAANINALELSNIKYQYIIFNDRGDPNIEQDIKHLVGKNVEYIYSDVNYGMGVQSGGWIGALKFIKGKYIHNTGQDDVFTAYFYKSLLERLQRPGIHLAYANGFVVDSKLNFTNQTMGPLHDVDYSDTRRVFDQWFGRQGEILTRANNYIPAPGVIYNIEVHNLIGLPAFEEFKGSADFEYWTRILFNKLGVSYDPMPSWLYRRSEYSLGVDKTTEINTVMWNQLILKKYQQCLTGQ